jgi:invasion protein IalB
MRNGRALQLTVPRVGGSETVDFDLDGFAEAYRRLEDR